MNQFSVYVLALIAVLTVGGFAYNRAIALSRRRASMSTNTIRPGLSGWHSQANYHGYFTAWITACVTLIILILGRHWTDAGVQGQIGLLATIIIAALTAVFIIRRFIHADFKARIHVEGFIKSLLILLSVIAVLTTLGIIFSLLFESLRFFKNVSFHEFLFGLQWSPQTALRTDQVGQSGSFGAIPVFAGTFLIMLVAMVIAGPIGLMIAIYLSEYASVPVRRWVKPAIEILAGVPTVVYGFFALLTFAPFVRQFAESLGMDVPTQSALAAGVVMGVMIIPFVSSLSSDVINAVPQTMRDGSYALGATESETMKQVVFTAALPGIIGAFMLAISRAVGETMIVYMAAGKAANLTANPFEAVTTVTVQIVALLTGDSDFDSPKTLVAFALGLVLFVITLLLNVIALTVVRKYRARYE